MELVSPAAEDYALAHTTPLPELLDELLAHAREELPSPGMLSGPVVGSLLQTLVACIQARRVLEIGTYAGYSALAMAGGLAPGGRLVTCEVDAGHAAFAERYIRRSPWAQAIEVRVGPALETIQAVEGPLDFVFIDADKGGYGAYYDAVLPKLAPGGLIAADNTLHAGRVLAGAADANADSAALREFNARLVADERVVATLLTVRDGITLIRRRGS